MSEIVTGYIKREFLYNTIQEILMEKSKIPVSMGDNKGYALGKSLGYSDALRDMLKLIRDLPEEHKPKIKYPTWHSIVK